MIHQLIQLVMFWWMSSNTLSVTSYGATGNGTTDDTQAIQACFNAAQTAHKNIVFPSGTYLCNQHTGTKILTYTASGQTGITIYGSDATILTTVDTATVQLYIPSFSTTNGLVLYGLNFVNTHPTQIALQTTAIQFAGTSGQDLTNIQMQQCNFTGFSVAIVVQGVNTFSMKWNHFNSPKGHCNAQPNGTPAVDVWFFDNANGYCQNVTVSNNWASGYTGVLPLTCARPFDGFLYGVIYGGTISVNTTRNFSEEHYYFLPYSTFPNSTAQLLITKNNVDCTLPPGCLEDNGSPHKYNYGIRSESSNTTITLNTITNYTSGIIVRGIDWPANTISNFSITYNDLTIGSDASLYSPNTGIFVQGNSGLISGVNVSNNNLWGSDTVQVQTYSLSSPIINNNPSLPVKLQ